MNDPTYSWRTPVAGDPAGWYLERVEPYPELNNCRVVRWWDGANWTAASYLSKGALPDTTTREFTFADFDALARGGVCPTCGVHAIDAARHYRWHTEMGGDEAAPSVEPRNYLVKE